VVPYRLVIVTFLVFGQGLMVTGLIGCGMGKAGKKEKEGTEST
jgi:hypothetical protein